MLEKKQKKIKPVDEILDVAHKLFLKQGYHATSLNMIAKDAGISRQTINRYFNNGTASKFALLDEILNKIIQQIDSELFNNIHRTDLFPQAQLEALKLLAMSFWQKQPSCVLISRLFCELDPNSEEFMKLLKEPCEQWYKKILYLCKKIEKQESYVIKRADFFWAEIFTQGLNLHITSNWLGSHGLYKSSQEKINNNNSLEFKHSF